MIFVVCHVRKVKHLINFQSETELRKGFENLAPNQVVLFVF